MSIFLLFHLKIRLIIIMKAAKDIKRFHKMKRKSFFANIFLPEMIFVHKIKI